VRVAADNTPLRDMMTSFGRKSGNPVDNVPRLKSKS